jgi:hypothetical protein
MVAYPLPEGGATDPAAIERAVSQAIAVVAPPTDDEPAPLEEDPQ